MTGEESSPLTGLPGLWAPSVSADSASHARQDSMFSATPYDGNIKSVTTFYFY